MYLFWLIERLNELVKFVIFFGIFMFFCVLIFSGKVFVFDCDVNVNISIGSVFFK